ncbi:hypothetical protein HY024_02515 [Candidatus Curtissbacteria bacterium]|nr:hypothetical protein [Candidatus Curtissbacteria bacterium]
MLFLNLKNFWPSIRKDYLLLVILLFGLILRTVNPTFDSPSIFVSNDEAIAHLSSLNMIANKTIYSISNYTPFGAYIQIPFIVISYLFLLFAKVVVNPDQFKTFLLVNQGYFLFVPRLISAGFGTLTILVLYKTSILLFSDKKAALVCAFLGAVSFNLVHISNTGRPWSAALFFITLSIYLSLKRKFFFSLVSCAVAFGFHQVGIVILPLLLILNPDWKLKSFIKIALFLIFIYLLNSLTLTTGLIQAIANNQSFLLKDKFLTDLIVGKGNLSESLVHTIYSNLGIYYIGQWLLSDGVIFAFGILGSLLAFRRGYIFKSIVFYVLLYFIFASLFFHPLLRYLLPIHLLLIPIAAFFISKIIRMGSLIILILLLSSINSIYWCYLYSKEPTFVSAQEWVKSHINPSIPIAYGGGRYQYLVPSREAALIMQRHDHGLFRSLSAKNYSVGGNVRNVYFLGAYPGILKSVQIANLEKDVRIAYVVDYYFDPRDSLLLGSNNRYELIKRFNPIRNGSYHPISEATFDATFNFNNGNMYQLEVAGPIFDILKVRY